jgi:hypothetical protein
MTDTTAANRWRSKRTKANAMRLSGLFVALSVSFIILAGVVLDKESVWLTILFAIFGGVLQTAVLGLIYEIWLRDDVEDSTLEKLGTSRDVREHGLVSLGRDSTIDWSAVLHTARVLCVVSHDPKSLLGRADGEVLNRAGQQKLEKLVMGVPEEEWDEVKPWLIDYVSRWQQAAPASEIMIVRLDSSPGYEFIGTDSRSIVLLSTVSTMHRLSAVKTLEFRQAESWGIGMWLNDQAINLSKLQPTLGYSPVRQTVQNVEAKPEVSDDSAKEELA